mmetsp:Transcript_31306/g.88756  ORF Transcript_31306/g.88756 Transcript_31306/m.88756 type:complete len:209 (+) Transcript_31306:3376-4002(+)
MCGAMDVPVKAKRWRVEHRVCQNNGEAVSIRAQGVVGLPHHLKGFLLFPPGHVLHMDTGEELGVHSCPLSKHGGVGLGVAEGIQLPADCRGRQPKLSCQELMPACHLVHHAHVVGDGLIMLHPSSVDPLDPSILHQEPEGGFAALILLHPPPLEEAHLAQRELAVRRLLQRAEDRIEYVLDASLVYAVVGPGIVLVDSLQPSSVQVGV